MTNLPKYGKYLTSVKIKSNDCYKQCKSHI